MEVWVMVVPGSSLLDLQPEILSWSSIPVLSTHKWIFGGQVI